MLNESGVRTGGIYLEDLITGDTFVSGEYQIDIREIREFAKQFDPQPFHLDEDAARNTLFAGLAASGWQIAAITQKLLVETVPLAGGLIGVGSKLTLPQPTRPGDVLHVVSTVIDTRPSRSKPDRGIVILQVNTLNQEEELCLTSVTRGLAFRRNSGIEPAQAFR
jgi:acyl dehydratase